MNTSFAFINSHIMKSILYTFRRCPYAMRARLALTYVEIRLEYREIMLKNKPQAMLDVSPKGTVPVLVLENGEIIDESLDIMLWALQQSDPENWLQHKEEAFILIEENDNTFKPWLDRYKYADRFPEQTQTFYRTQGELFLHKLENKLSQSTFLFGNHPTLADFAIFPFVRQFASVDKAWFNQSAYPKLQKWLNSHLESSLFEKTMVKRPVWVQE
ncbi:MAG: glutathione S-transferase [Ghiorsea sp.]|nr:glutathione S-transferase [Ghiorsea sp.]